MVAALPLATASAAPNRVSATGDEQSQEQMSLILSRAKIDPGRAIIEFINSGEDVHDLQVKRKGAQDVQGETGLVDPGTAGRGRPEAEEGVEVPALVLDRRPS